MDLENTLKELKIDDSFYDFMSLGWKDSSSCIPKVIDFLEPKNIQENMRWCDVPDEYFSDLNKATLMIKASPAFAAVAWHCHRQLYSDRRIECFADWPVCEPFPVLYLLVALAMVPLVRKKHYEMGVKEEVTRDTCFQVKCFCENHLRAFKSPGIIAKQLPWFRHYVDGRLFRLGRMEYRMEKVKGFGKVFENKETGEVIAFCLPGVRYSRKGFVDSTARAYIENDVWESVFRETKDFVKGNPVSPYGYAMEKEIELSLEQWKCVIEEGDFFLDMHIPSGGGMTLDLCIDSMRKAVEFCDKYFPEQETKAIMCRSWIFNTQFEKQMPDSNLAGFMRELYLFPIQSTARDGFFFVFGREFDDLSQAPRATSLQCAMLDILAREPLRTGGMFILKQDLKYFGSQHYRKQADANSLFSRMD